MTMPSLQEILQIHGERLRAKHRFPKWVLVAMDALSRCRTAAMGGHIERCPDGHYEHHWYNSCKHRACPKCRSILRARWHEKQMARLMACPHHHVIFTLPEELNILWRYNRELMIELLFHVVRDTLFVLLGDERYGGIVPGLLCSLHTWGRNLCLHPHLHCIITAFGFRLDGTWGEPKKANLLPYLVVRELYRGKMIAAIRDALEAGKLVLPPSLLVFQLQNTLNELGRQSWNVEIRERYSSAKGVLSYLARYVGGGCISDSQIKSSEAESVSFTYLDHRDETTKEMRLSPEAFLMRFLQHVPPPRKKLVRYYGLYAEHNEKLLNEARAALGQARAERPQFLAWQAFLSKIGRESQSLCPVCGKPLVLGRRLRRWSTYHPGIEGPHEAAA